jgi:hypothetical protein
MKTEEEADLGADGDNRKTVATSEELEQLINTLYAHWEVLGAHRAVRAQAES